MVIRSDIGWFQGLKSIKGVERIVQRILHRRQFPQFQAERELAGATAKEFHRALPVNGAALRHKMEIFFAVVIVYVRGANTWLHDLEFIFDARAEMGVAGIENVIQIHMGEAVEEFQTLGTGKFVGRVFEQNFNATLARKNAELFERGESGINRFI
jgi:hypothetical protein